VNYLIKYEFVLRQAGGKVAPFEIDEYCSTFEKKMGSFLQPRSLLSDEEANKLGMKNEEDEVEKFVQVSFFFKPLSRLILSFDFSLG